MAIGWRARWALPAAAARLVDLLRDQVNQVDAEEYLRRILCASAPERSGLKGEEDSRNTIDELFRRSAAYRKSEAFREMIAFCARFRAYSPFNVMLVRLQNPGCSFFATEKYWRKEFGCVLKEDARPMIILAPMHPVLLVYDLDEVVNPPLPETLKAFTSVTGDWDSKRLRKLARNTDKLGIRVDIRAYPSTLGGFIELRPAKSGPRMRIVVNECLDDRARYGVLCHELAHALLGHLGPNEKVGCPSRQGLDLQTVEIEAEAAAHIVLTRAGLKSPAVPYLSSYIRDESVPQTVSIELITKVAGRIEDMSLNTIQQPRKRKSRKKGAE